MTCPGVSVQWARGTFPLLGACMHSPRGFPAPPHPASSKADAAVHQLPSLLHSHSPEVGVPAGMRVTTQREATCQQVWARQGAGGGVLSAGEACRQWGVGGAGTSPGPAL